MSKPEDELEFINVVDHDTGSSFSGRATGSGGGGGEGGSINNGGFVGGHLGFIRQSRNPMTAFFHYVFKFLALFIYVMGGWVSSYTIMTYILCILFLVFDFWTVKNISGRLMVGLRWWSNVREDGTTEWVFESLEDMSEISSADYKLFWIGLYGTPLLWFGLLMLSLIRLKFNWMVIVITALLLSGANIYGYTKCNADAKNKVKQMVSDGMLAGAVRGLGNAGFRNTMFSLFAGGAPQQPPPQNQMGTHHI